MFEPGAPLSPSGWVVMNACGRRARITRYKIGTCTWCSGEVKKPRRTWCSEECVDQMRAMDPNAIRSRVLKRDEGKPCPLCGSERFFGEVDHIVPIIEGGHPFDLANLRTICTDCHKQETAALRRRIAEARRAAMPREPEQLAMGGV